MKREEFIPTQLNEHPPVFKGCSFLEIKMAARHAAFVALIVSVVLTVIVQIFMLFFGFMLASFMFALVIRIRQIVKQKRGRPVGYFDTMQALNDQKKGRKKHFVKLKSSPWEVTRT